MSEYIESHRGGGGGFEKSRKTGYSIKDSEWNKDWAFACEVAEGSHHLPDSMRD